MSPAPDPPARSFAHSSLDFVAAHEHHRNGAAGGVGDGAAGGGRRSCAASSCHITRRGVLISHCLEERSSRHDELGLEKRG